MTTPLDIINCVIDKLKDPEHWIRGKYAETAEGKDADPYEEDAVSFCVLGALTRCWKDAGGTHKTYDTIRDLMMEETTIGIATFNDHPMTSHADMMAMLRRVREKASG